LFFEEDGDDFWKIPANLLGMDRTKSWDEQAYIYTKKKIKTNYHSGIGKKFLSK